MKFQLSEINLDSSEPNPNTNETCSLPGTGSLRSATRRTLRPRLRAKLK